MEFRIFRGERPKELPSFSLAVVQFSLPTTESLVRFPTGGHRRHPPLRKAVQRAPFPTRDPLLFAFDCFYKLVFVPSTPPPRREAAALRRLLFLLLAGEIFSKTILICPSMTPCFARDDVAAHYPRTSRPLVFLRDAMRYSQ